MAIYKENLDEDGQVEFKGKGKAFVRNVRLSVIGPALLECELGEAVDLPQLPDPQVVGPKEEDLARGLLETIDTDSYRVEKRRQANRPR